MFRFGDFELDTAGYELRRGGKPVRLERPMELLILLVERRQQLVSRADIGARLWGPDVFIDLETSVNTAVRKVRRALGEGTEPQLVVTVPGKSYRFTAAVEVAQANVRTVLPCCPSTT